MAAGRGIRMMPLTKNIPKAMAPLNESTLISEAIKELANQIISIPRFGEMQQTESLNVATATAILLSEFKRGNELFK